MDPTPNTTIKTFPSIEKIQIELRQTAKSPRYLYVSLDRHTFFMGQNPFEQKESI